MFERNPCQPKRRSHTNHPLAQPTHRFIIRHPPPATTTTTAVITNGLQASNRRHRLLAWWACCNCPANCNRNPQTAADESTCSQNETSGFSICATMYRCYIQTSICWTHKYIYIYIVYSSNAEQRERICAKSPHVLVNIESSERAAGYCLVGRIRWRLRKSIISMELTTLVVYFRIWAQVFVLSHTQN